MEKPGKSEVTYSDLSFIILVESIQNLLITTYNRPEKGRDSTSPCSWFPLDVISCPAWFRGAAESRPQCCVLCFASTVPALSDVVAWHQRLKAGACWPSPGRWIGLHCAQWGKLLPPPSVLAVNPFIYLHLKLAFLQLVGHILNTATFPFLKINHNMVIKKIVATCKRRKLQGSIHCSHFQGWCYHYF